MLKRNAQLVRHSGKPRSGAHEAELARAGSAAQAAASSPRRLSGRPQKRGHGPKPSRRPSAEAAILAETKRPPVTNVIRRGRRRKSNDGRGNGDKICQTDRSMVSQLPDGIVRRIVE